MPESVGEGKWRCRCGVLYIRLTPKPPFSPSRQAAGRAGDPCPSHSAKPRKRHAGGHEPRLSLSIEAPGQPCARRRAPCGGAIRPPRLASRCPRARTPTATTGARRAPARGASSARPARAQTCRCLASRGANSPAILAIIHPLTPLPLSPRRSHQPRRRPQSAVGGIGVGGGRQCGSRQRSGRQRTLRRQRPFRLTLLSRSHFFSSFLSL